MEVFFWDDSQTGDGRSLDCYCSSTMSVTMASGMIAVRAMAGGPTIVAKDVHHGCFRDAIRYSTLFISPFQEMIY